MRSEGTAGQREELLRRITGETDARDALARVARELRRRHDLLGDRRRRRAGVRADSGRRPFDAPAP